MSSMKAEGEWRRGEERGGGGRRGEEGGGEGRGKMVSVLVELKQIWPRPREQPFYTSSVLSEVTGDQICLRAFDYNREKFLIVSF
jgi:hypothetical protein